MALPHTSQKGRPQSSPSLISIGPSLCTQQSTAPHPTSSNLKRGFLYLGACFGTLTRKKQLGPRATHCTTDALSLSLPVCSSDLCRLYAGCSRIPIPLCAACKLSSSCEYGFTTMADITLYSANIIALCRLLLRRRRVFTRGYSTQLLLFS